MNNFATRQKLPITFSESLSTLNRFEEKMFSKIAARSSECLETSTSAGRFNVSKECLLTKLLMDWKIIMSYKLCSLGKNKSTRWKANDLQKIVRYFYWNETAAASKLANWLSASVRFISSAWKPVCSLKKTKNILDISLETQIRR